MQEFVKTFFSELHRVHFKPRGYKKVRHTFSRTMTGYTERVQFQGSSWNNSKGPWRFYINFGVEFLDLPLTPRKVLPDTHSWTRIKDIVSDAPQDFDLPKLGQTEFAITIASLVEQASQNVSDWSSHLRHQYDLGKLYPTRWHPK